MTVMRTGLQLHLTMDRVKGTTEKLLDGLKERGVKATFLVGEKIEDNRELVAENVCGGASDWQSYIYPCTA